MTVFDARSYGAQLGLRWTIGDARPRAFEMLRLSIACAFQLFGAGALYRVCVNHLSADEAATRTGALPARVDWQQVRAGDIAPVLRPLFDSAMAEGVGWKLAPLQSFPGRHELALDNDCLLWALPEGMRAWLDQSDRCLIAEDVGRCLGIFDALCPPGYQNSGIRGLPPGFDFAATIEAVLAEAQRCAETRLQLTSELDEQGLQAAAVSWAQPAFRVRVDEVSICSPFWPRSTELGSCGAHFVGSNPAHLPWRYFDRTADECMEELWQRHRPTLYRRACLPLPNQTLAPPHDFL